MRKANFNATVFGLNNLNMTFKKIFARPQINVHTYIFRYSYIYIYIYIYINCSRCNFHLLSSITISFHKHNGSLTCHSLEEKLDVRINQDGTCGVPGLTETLVNNVDDVLKCIGDTWSLQGEGTMVNGF